MIIRIFLRVSIHITRFIEYSLNIFTLLYQYLSITASNITESNRLDRLFFTKMCEAFVFGSVEFETDFLVSTTIHNLEKKINK